ncbi:hypothetical protein PV326_007556, partial [Microctonus aethiopoides]
MSANMSDVQGRKRDRNQHIQVFVRVKLPNQSKMSSKSLMVVDVSTPRECVVRERPQDKSTQEISQMIEYLDCHPNRPGEGLGINIYFIFLT